MPLVSTEELNGGCTLIHAGRAVRGLRRLECYAESRRISVVPGPLRGVFRALTEVREFPAHSHAEPSALGGERERVVSRFERAFSAADFQEAVCKSVRANHVQTDEHRTRHWKACRIVGPVEAADHQ